MKIKELISVLDTIAPFFLQEKYDNSGVQIADLDEKIGKILLCLDVTEDVVQEAIDRRCNVLISHHPLFFLPLNRITKQENPVAYQLLHYNINLIAFHTNFDLAENGLNDYFGKLLGLKKTDCLEESPEKTLKLAVYVPLKYQEKLLDALFQSGAGNIGNYSETSFSASGKGSFKPLEGSKPFIGKTGERESVQEIKIETVFRERDLNRVINAVHQNHPYEEPAYDIYQLETKSKTGIGSIAKLDSEQSLVNICETIKKELGIPYLRVVQSKKQGIKTIALCSGGGGSLLEKAIQKKADLFITGDIKHHEALRAREMGLNIIDIEHFYTERYFVPALKEQLMGAGFPKKLLFASEKMSPSFQLF